MKMETVGASVTAVNPHKTIIVKAMGKVSAISPQRELLYTPVLFRNIKVYVLLTSDTFPHTCRDVHGMDDWEIKVHFLVGKRHFTCLLPRDQV